MDSVGNFIESILVYVATVTNYKFSELIYSLTALETEAQSQFHQAEVKMSSGFLLEALRREFVALPFSVLVAA